MTFRRSPHKDDLPKRTGRRLTPAQKRLVAELDAGQKLVRSFDVHGGFWWWLRPTQTRVKAATAERLLAVGAIVGGENKRIYSGYHEMIFTAVRE